MPNNYFNVIICHNLIQHIPTELLVIELKEIIRSLKPTGVFALEFISSGTREDTGRNKHYLGNEVGTYCRSPKYLSDLIITLGGNSDMVIDNKCNFGDITGCHVFHVRKIIEINKI
jgi:SAM-dependent methyltransferase